jgi:hypothetical protein
VAVVVADHEERIIPAATNLDDLAGAFYRTDDTSVDDDAIPDARMHADHLLPATIRRAGGEG